MKNIFSTLKKLRKELMLSHIKILAQISNLEILLRAANPKAKYYTLAEMEKKILRKGKKT